MFQFTDSHGYPVEPTPVDLDSVRGSDVAFLPILLKAAHEADDAGYCEVFDNIAQAIGGPTRQDLRDIGLLVRSFDVEVSRRVRVEVYVNQSTTVTVEASNPAGAREALRDGEVDIDWPDIDGYDLRHEDIEVDDDGDFDIDRVSASE